MTKQAAIAGAALSECDGEILSDPARFGAEVVARAMPVVLRGAAARWPIVAAGRAGPAALASYLLPRAANGPVDAFFGERAIGGRYFYGANLSEFNFERRRLGFADALKAIFDGVDNIEGWTAYLGSIPTTALLRDFAADNPVPALPPTTVPRLWLGHMSNVSCHFDTMDNVAIVIAGRRHFTLYPPDAIGDLYVGPIDNTMAGQPVSLAAALPPEEADTLYPRFAAARARALVAELAPGDAIYMPKLWWHQVEGLCPLNGLINYWWDATASGPDAPYAAMLLALITLAERPPAERHAWRAFFDHYVFRRSGHPLAHLDPAHHGLLGSLRPTNYGRIRAIVMSMLRR